MHFIDGGGCGGEQFYWAGLVFAPIAADLALSDIFRLEEKLFKENPQGLVNHRYNHHHHHHHGDH